MTDQELEQRFGQMAAAITDAVGFLASAIGTTEHGEEIASVLDTLILGAGVRKHPFEIRLMKRLLRAVNEGVAIAEANRELDSASPPSFHDA